MENWSKFSKISFGFAVFCLIVVTIVTINVSEAERKYVTESTCRWVEYNMKENNYEVDVIDYDLRYHNEERYLYEVTLESGTYLLIVNPDDPSSDIISFSNDQTFIEK